MSYNPKDVLSMSEDIAWELEELHSAALVNEYTAERICEVLSTVDSILSGLRAELSENKGEER